MSADADFFLIIDRSNRRIQDQLKIRCYRGANALRNAALDILAGQRSGKRYYIPGTKTKYSASVGGQPPAVRTGTFRNSWIATGRVTGHAFISRIESRVAVSNGHLLGDYLEHGTGRMAARPHQERIRQRALPEIQRIYQEPYLR